VIMLTARDSKRDMAQMRAAGASAYLVKPFSQDKCIALVERTLAERRLIAYKEASSLFISEGARAAAEERAARGEALAFRADERTVTVMFSDLVGFTPLSSVLSPAELIALLNDYFDVMCPIVKQHAGDIDKFIGDAIMAVFDEMRGKPPSAERAVRAPSRCRRRCRGSIRVDRRARDADRDQHRAGRARRPRLARRAPRLHGDR